MLYLFTIKFILSFIFFFKGQIQTMTIQTQSLVTVDSEIRPKKKKKTLPPLPIPPSPAKANGQNSKSQDLISSGNSKARTSGQSMKLISLMILINSYESDNFQKMIFKFLFLEFELKVLKGIEQMRLQMQHNTTMLQLLLKKVDLPAFQDDDEDQSCLPNMPITSLEQFDEVNEAIKNDIRNRMVSFENV